MNYAVLAILSYFFFKSGFAFVTLQRITVLRRVLFHSAVLLGFFFKLPTPNYNTINAMATLMVAIGLNNFFTFDIRNKVTSSSVSLGGFLSFVAKTDNAVALGLVSLVALFLCFNKREAIRLASISLVAFLI